MDLVPPFTEMLARVCIRPRMFSVRTWMNSGGHAPEQTRRHEAMELPSYGGGARCQPVHH